MGVETDAIDGRHQRRAQNREAVLDALLALFAEGDFQPRVAEIAERAGLSARSLFRYFDDVDELSRAAIARHQEVAAHLAEVHVDPDEPTNAKVDELVSARAALYDAITPTARAARAAAHRNGLIAAELRGRRQALRRQLAATFAPELRDRPGALAMLDVAASFEAYDLLRSDQRLSRPRAMRAMSATMTAILNGPTS